MGFNSDEPGSVPGWGWQCSLNPLRCTRSSALSRQSGADSDLQPGSISVYQHCPQPQWAHPILQRHIRQPGIAILFTVCAYWKLSYLELSKTHVKCRFFPLKHLRRQSAHMPWLSWFCEITVFAFFFLLYLLFISLCCCFLLFVLFCFLLHTFSIMGERPFRGPSKSSTLNLHR